MIDTRPPETGDAPPPPRIPGPRRQGRWLDHLLGADPGLNRLRSATLSVVTIAVILGAEALFVRLTHALQVPTTGAGLTPARAVAAALADHEYLVIMMLLGAIVG